MDKKKGAFTSYYEAFSGSIEPKQTDPRWKSGVLMREFEVGDLVTLAPDYRYSAMYVPSNTTGKYIGIVTAAYANREYVVTWTARPASTAHGGMYNGDHLLKIEHADMSLL